MSKQEAPEGAKPKSKRGFASMDPAKVREIARKGGKAVHESGRGHQFTVEEAREAGRKGGMAPHKRRGKAVQFKPKDRPTAEERTGFLPMPLDSEPMGPESFGGEDFPSGVP